MLRFESKKERVRAGANVVAEMPKVAAGLFKSADAQ